MKKMALSAALFGTLVAGAASAGIDDSWITTRAKIALLTTDGFSVNGANVDTNDGKVTLHGKVATAGDRTRAEQTVRKVKGCLLYTSPSPRDRQKSRMPSSA